MAKAALYAALKLIFPPECYHCKSEHEKLGAPLCSACLTFLDPRPSEGEILITFESIGPAQSLMAGLKKGSSPKLISLLAAYMAVQYSQSAHPLPDLITAVPTSWWRKWQMGQETAAELAKELSILLERPFLPLLKRKRQLYRQDLLSREERLHLSSEEFVYKTKQSLHGKTLLLIDDTITTGATLACCAERLWEAAPSKIIKMACVDRGYLKQ